MKTPNQLQKLLGFHYVLNKSSREIHDFRSATKRCNIGMLKHGKRITGRRARRMIAEGTGNPCAHCIKQ